MQINRFGNQGFARSGDSALTFEILSATDQLTIEEEKASMTNLLKVGECFAHGDYTVAAYGDSNNLPMELRELIKRNHLLPEILKKQVRFLYGEGPALFEHKIEENKIVKTPLARSEFQKVWDWLESWEQNGLKDGYESFLKQVILEYYYSEGIFSKWIYNKSRRTGGSLPVRGLEYIQSQRCRLAKPGQHQFDELLEDEDFTYILQSRWDKPHRLEAESYPRFNSSNPLKHSVAINYTRDFGFGEDIYSYPTFYYGLKDWILGSNLNAKYVNSYLKNSLSAKIHVIIPDRWISRKEQRLEDLCNENIQRNQNGTKLISEYDGIKLTELNGESKEVPLAFDTSMAQALIDRKIDELLKVMSGEGKNQGKTFVTRSFKTEHGIEEWDFKEIPVKYKEFIESIIDINKHAVDVILAGKGVPPSISSVSKEGVFQTSGSDTYYNYMIYLSSQNYAEEFCTMDINRALRINFPSLKARNIKLGFHRNMPDKQEEIKPDDRLTKTVP